MPDAPQMPTLPSPSRLSEYAFGYERTAALKAAVGLELFTAIGEGRDTSIGLAERCGAAERGIRILCNYLVALGLLTREGDRYSAAPDVTTFLDRRSPAFIGGALDFVASETALKAALSDPVAIVRRGGTILTDGGHLAAPDHQDWTAYARAMAPLMARSADFLANLVVADPATVIRVLDIAAGPGQNGIAIAKRLPRAEVTAVDWPSVLEVARKNAQAADVNDRWKAVPGSALETPLGGPYDVVLIVRLLHLIAPQECEILLRRAHAALVPGGRLVALQVMLNDDHVSSAFATMMNFNVLATTPSGEVRTVAEMETLLRNCGFQRTEWHSLPDSDEHGVVGWKQETVISS